MATYLLNTGEPVIADGMLTQSPFANQYTPTGLLSFERAELKPRLSPDGRVVVESAPITDQTPRTRPVLNRPVEEPPVSPPSFSMDVTQSTPGTYGYGPVAEATSPAAFSSYGVEDFGALGGANQAEVNANLAAQNAAAAYNAAQPGLLGSLTTPTGILGSMYGVLSGVPGMTSLMNAMASRNNAALAFDRAMELQGVPGYSTGQINGQAFSISPGLLESQVLTGVLPSWFDVEMAENMAAVQAGIDPETGSSLSSTGTGKGGYSSDGYYVDPFGQKSLYGTRESLEREARNLMVTPQQLFTAKEIAKELNKDLFDILGVQPFDPPDYDPNYDPTDPNQEPDINLDPLSGEIDYDVEAQEAEAAANLAAVPDAEAADYGGGGDTGGYGGTHICTAAFKAGISPKERFRANKKYGIKLRREDPVLMRGYDLVGPWIAKKIGHTSIGNALTCLYEKKASGEKLSISQKILDAALNLTTRPALRLVGRFA